VRISESRRHNSDDLIGLPVKVQKAPQNVLPSAKGAVPKPIADHHRSSTAGLHLLAVEDAAKLRDRLQHMEEVGIHRRRS
jgi:hypothetical protein